MVLGITGKYCSGKNSFAELLAERGFHLIDVDRYGHRALERKKPELLREFGNEILTDSGEIDRKRLGSIVFSDEGRLRALEAVVHPAMKSMVAEEIRDRESAANIAINAAILLRMGLEELCEGVVWVTASPPVRFFRALRRDGFAPLRVLKRMRSQRDVSPQFSSTDVDIYTVRNNGNLAQLRKEAERVLKELGVANGTE
jgi:dephospho-CoA kinase